MTPTGNPDHATLMSLLGAWALGTCAPDEATSVERHLADCAACGEEGARLRQAAELLEPQRSLDLDPGLRARVLGSCLDDRPAHVPVPSWATPYDAEAARLDALLDDITAEEWRAPVTWPRCAQDRPRRHRTTVAGVLGHLLAEDGLVVRGLRRRRAEAAGSRAGEATADWAAWTAQEPDARQVRRVWREQSRALVRAAGEAGGRTTATVPYPTPERFADGRPALRDAFLCRALACWIHAADIADAVDYPYDPPPGAQLRLLVDLVARRLPVSLACRRRAGHALSPVRLGTAGAPGRSLHLEVEGKGGGDWYVPLDSPTATVTRSSARQAVAHVALEDADFCRLAAGRITPEDAAAGQEGDPRAIHDVLYALAALSQP